MAKRRLNSVNITDIAYENIQADRSTASMMLTEIMELFSAMQNPNDKREYLVQIGPTITKLIEAQQRSNDQIVKIAAIIKKASDSEEDFSQDDYTEVLKEIQNEDLAA